MTPTYRYAGLATALLLAGTGANAMPFCKSSKKVYLPPPYVVYLPSPQQALYYSPLPGQTGARWRPVQGATPLQTLPAIQPPYYAGQIPTR